MPLNQYQLVQDIGRAHHVYDETRSLGALLSLLRGNSVANFNDLSLQAQRTSLAQMHFINNSLGNFPSLESASVNGEVNGSFVLAEHIQSLRNAQNVSTVSNPRTDEPSLQNQRQDIEDCNAVRLTLYISDDDVKLNENQIFLRQNIELFRATQKDILCITRGKNKPIVLHQVGIRCCHCSHVPAGRRKKGSTYFPSNLIGLYQAAQNLCVEHLQSGLCTELPPDVKERFVAFASGKKSGASSAGKKYWAEAGRKLGLIDTDDGIHFASDRVDDRQTWESADYVGQRAAMADRFA
jgi:CMP-N-acetylneuraminic acid synthetase